MDKTLTTFVAACLTLAAAGAAAQPAAYVSALTGSWKGTLEYRDYRSDRRVTLPTTLLVTPSADGLTLAYTYDDGPGKTVRSTERITIGGDGSTYRVQNGAGTYDATFAAVGLREFGKGTNTVVLVGTGTENDKPVDIRITVKIDGDGFAMLRESRLSGADWLYRNQYQFKRDAGPRR